MIGDRERESVLQHLAGTGSALLGTLDKFGGRLLERHFAVQSGLWGVGLLPVADADPEPLRAAPGADD
jgi:hypothetical protein